ncbi:MAG: glycoside hydrolase family 13 protein [Chitinophagaceae bacterium]
MRRFLPGLVVVILFNMSSLAQDIKFYPTNWWVGMKSTSLQLMIHGKEIANQIPMYKLSAAGVRIADGVTLKKVNRVENPDYLFLDLQIAGTAKAGMREFILPGSHLKINYELKSKDIGDGKTRIQGVTQSDFIYLLMPDRFANGDPSNDFFRDMRDTAHDRYNPFDRHGGDLKGIEDHLDYLKELGVTAIWPTPVVENDMARTMEGGTSRSTYHGYAFTDQYTIDKRFGTNEEYKHLVNTAHNKGLKFIQDAVYNHIGQDHWSMMDLPMKDWINQWPSYTNTSHKIQATVDPYASTYDRKVVIDGWFTPFLADLNQKNPYVSNFLIQYAIWATEEFGIDGWRVDTYFYNDPVFLNKMNDALLKEFPRLTVFGETLAPTILNVAYYAQNNFSDVPFKHNLQGITDLPLTNAILDGLKQSYGWLEGVNRVYSTLAQDYVYKDPSRNCIFLDNHDLDRYYSVIGENILKYKMGINWLLTLRGIPQLYYGTEILMKNFKSPTDAEVRKDFPGGWKEDKMNKFTKEGRTAEEQDAFAYVSALANFRKTSSALTKGKLMQYTPQGGLYVYFRYDSQQTIMVASNTSAYNIIPSWSYFSERTNGFTKARNVITGEVKALNEINLQPEESFVVELMK